MKILAKRDPAVNRVPVVSSYSGNAGFYCAMYPTSGSLQRVVDHVAKVPQFGDSLVAPPLMHVTIMYSDHAIPIPELPWIIRDRVITADVIGYDFFIKPHKDTGALVMLLKSPDLDAYHEELATLAEYTWDEYKPHLTLAYDVDPTTAAILVSALNTLPMPQGLEFTAPVFEDKT